MVTIPVNASVIELLVRGGYLAAHREMHSRSQIAAAIAVMLAEAAAAE